MANFSATHVGEIISIRYDARLISNVRSSKRQESFLSIHEWLRSKTEENRAIWNANAHIHSENFLQDTSELALLTLKNLVIFRETSQALD